MSILLLGFLGSLAAGLMTGVGALPVLWGRPVPRWLNDTFLGFAAGVMLSASFFSLIVPGIEAGALHYGGTRAGATIAALGIGLGAAAVAWLHRVAPHEHFVEGREGGDPGGLSRIWLFVIAIALHNFPEGMAVGVGFGGGDIENGLALATGMGVQNALEGLAVALALRGQGYGRGRSFRIALFTGLVEPVGGLFGAGLVSASVFVLPWGLAFAAGAMLYIISHEIIPETHRHGHQDRATAGLLVGLIGMMFLDVTMG